MAEAESSGYFEVRFPKTPTITTSINLFNGIRSSFANCYFGSEKAYMAISDPLPEEKPGDDLDTKYRRVFEEDRPTIQLLQFGSFCARRAIEFPGPQGHPVRVVDPRADESFNILAGQYDKVGVTPPVFRFRERVNTAIQAAIFSDIKHASQERLQTARQISYYEDVASAEESPYPNQFKNNPDLIGDGIIPDSPATIADYLLENVYWRETFDPDYILAAVKKLQRQVGSLNLDIERLYHQPTGRNVSLSNITFFGQYIDFAHKVFRDVRKRPPEQRFCELDALKIAASRRMSGRVQRQLAD
jgi:hypothetical protein